MSDPEYDLDFSSHAAIEIPVSIPDRKSGKVVNYFLREAIGDAVVKYENEMLKCTQLGESGRPSSVRGMADVEPLLVSMCLFFNCPEDTKFHNQPVAQSVIRAFPSRILKKLYETAKQISEIGTDTDVKTLEGQLTSLLKKLAAARERENHSKNEPLATEAGSE